MQSQATIPVRSWKAAGRVVSAPGRLWLRARGLARVALTAAYGLVIGLLLCASAWIADGLGGPPDVGDPFDVQAQRDFDLPDDQNAFVEYQKAADLLGLNWRRTTLSRVAWAEEWARADANLRDALETSRPGLELWREGTEKPSAMYHRPKDVNYAVTLPVTEMLRDFSRLALLEGSRLEESGDVAGAWRWYRAVLRCSRHSGMHGFLIERFIGATMYTTAARPIERWAAKPKVDAAMLRRALDDVNAADAMTSNSEPLKMDYLATLNELEDPVGLVSYVSTADENDPAGWLNRLPLSHNHLVLVRRASVARQRSRTKRVARLIHANWLAGIDDLSDARNWKEEDGLSLHEAGPTRPSTGEIHRWYRETPLARLIFKDFLTRYRSAVKKERDARARIVLTLAEQLFIREHQGMPPKTLGELVGPSLKALPEGYKASDPPLKP